MHPQIVLNSTKAELIREITPEELEMREDSLLWRHYKV